MRYSAFISYNHRDRDQAVWLHRALERYRVPARLRGREGALGPIADRLPPVFRDRDELAASADLGQAVRDALNEAATLIVICSPNGAQSRWVNEEIRYFAALGRRDRIRCLIVGGEPHARDPAEECLPPALIESGIEPLAADLRPGQDGKRAALLKLIASILGLPYDTLRQRDAQRRQRQLAAIAAASTIGFALALGLAVFAFLSRAEAVEQRQIAERRTATAERTVEFVQSMFETADPSNARGETITAREVLDAGAKRIAGGLGQEPAVRADLAITLSEVYGTLGLFREADRLIRWSLAIPHGDASVRVRQLAALGGSAANLGDYARAARLYERAVGEARAGAASDRLARALIGLGQARTALGQHDAADRAIREALRIDRARFGEDHSDVALALEALGRNALDAGDFPRAEQLAGQALAIRRRVEGEASPSVSDNLSQLGAIAYLRGDLAAADRYFTSRIAVDEKVLGRDHPDVAASLNNLARVRLERGDAAGALPLLERAVPVAVRERGETHDQMAFLYANLAIAQRELGRSQTARPLFEKALAAARLHAHRNRAPILADLADLDCRAGDTAQGLARLREAAPIMAADYPDDPWRTAWVEAVRGACLARAGDRAAARSSLQAAAPTIRERWPEGTLYRRMLEAMLRL